MIQANSQQERNALFEEPFGTGYPAEDAQRKKREAGLLKIFC